MLSYLNIINYIYILMRIFVLLFFIPVFLLTITVALPVSDPVPAVVGTAMIGAILLESALFQ